MDGKRFQIFVKTVYGNTITLNVSGRDKISDIKQQIYDKQGIPIIHQMLTYKGKNLESNINIHNIWAHGIHEFCTLYLSLRLSSTKNQNGAKSKNKNKAIDGNDSHNINPMSESDQLKRWLKEKDDIIREKQDIIQEKEDIIVSYFIHNYKKNYKQLYEAEVGKTMRLQNEISILQNKTGRSYVLNEVIQYKPKYNNQVTIRIGVQQKQLNMEETMNIHMNRLKKWHNFTIKLQSQFIKNGVDDEKKQHMEDQNHQMEISTVELLESYRKSMKLLRSQQSRSDDIGEYVISLSKLKKKLKNTIKQYNMNQQPTKQKHDELCKSYTPLKSQRAHLQQKLVNLANQINKITDEENKINQQKCETIDMLNVSIIEKEKYDQLLAECKLLSTKYKEFEKSVDRKTDELQKYFQQKWDSHESLWTKWDVDDIACYDNKIKLSKEVNLEEVAKEMRAQKFRGKSLSKIEKNDLKLFGINLFDDYQQIYKQIRQLIEKYPNIDNGHDDGNNDAIEGGIIVTQKVNIPPEYLCPISGKIMMNPVIYDGVTYDRNNFLQYIEQKGTIPNADEQYDEDEDIFKNTKLKQKIDAFLSVYPQYQNEGV